MVLKLDCVFIPSAGGPRHHYYGMVRRVGVDLVFTQNVSMRWVVFAPTGIVHPGDLAGIAAACRPAQSFGVGLGANAMIGGSNNSLALQPISGQAQAGLVWPPA